jgi:hypothetical protein
MGSECKKHFVDCSAQFLYLLEETLDSKEEVRSGALPGPLTTSVALGKSLSLSLFPHL